MPFFVSRPDCLAGFRAGRREVLEALYRAYFEPRSGQRVSGVPAADVADLVQEVFARAFRESARYSYDGIREYGPFLYAIARNVLNDWGRRLRREPELSEAASEIDDQTAETRWADEEVIQVVREYLDGLPLLLRAVHEERYVRGRAQIDAAAALGLTRQQLRTLEHKLRAGLKSALRRAKIDLE
jgi:RNA polymerase sigma factor (sigma-70 family)